MPTDLTRISELEHLDSLGTDAVHRVGREIKRVVADPGLWDSVVLKVSRFVVERKLSPSRVGEILDVITARRRLPENDKRRIASPGRYFTMSVKAECRKAGIDWHTGEYTNRES